MTVRWRFEDPSVPETETVPLNPNQMSSIFQEKTLDYAVTVAPDGQPLVTESQAPPKTWEFSGVLLTKEHYDLLAKWYGKRKKFYLHDHYDRRLTVYLTNYAPIPQRSVLYPWRHNYTVNAVIFGIQAADGTLIQGKP